MSAAVMDRDEARAHATRIVFRERIVRHEVGHLAGFLIAGMVPKRIEVSPTEGRVTSDWEHFALTDNLPGVIRAVIAGPLCDGGAVPTWPLYPYLPGDERSLAVLTEHGGIDEAGYSTLVRETFEMAATKEFMHLELIFGAVLRDRDALDGEQIREVLRRMGLCHYINEEESVHAS